MNREMHRGSGTRLGGHAPVLRGVWDAHRITAVLAAAMVPPAATAIYLRGMEAGGGLILALVVVLAWQTLFARLRGRLAGWDGLIGALAFALLAPEQAPLWQQALALSFGVVIGEQIFGGRGWSFLNPAVVGLAFLLFSFPGLDLQPAGVWLAAASLPGALLLLASGLISWRVMVAVAASLAGTALITGAELAWDEMFTGTIVFGVVFLACDPVSAAATNVGRWCYGFLTGALLVVFGLGGEQGGSIHVLVFAVLVASIFAPLIDHCVVALNIRRRRVRNG